jgi:hypothetical protein
MFPPNTILAWNINIIMNKKYDNNNIIIASRAYFLHAPPRLIDKRREWDASVTTEHTQSAHGFYPSSGRESDSHVKPYV